MVDKNDCLECGSGKYLIISTEFNDLLYCKNCSLLKKKNLFNQKKKVISLKKFNRDVEQEINTEYFKKQINTKKNFKSNQKETLEYFRLWMWLWSVYVCC